MSDAEKSPLDLTGLDFGPSWAKDKTPARDYSKEVGPREKRDRRGKGPRREGGDRRQSNDRRNQRDRREDGGGGGNSGGGDRRRNDRRGGGDRRNQREPRVETPAPEGFVGGVMPVEEGLDNLAAEIKGGGRTYSVFDLARVVMGARERFNVTFEAPKGSKIFRSKSDGSLWLSKEEAVRHFWQANLLSELYEEVETEVEAPKGNFTSVAKCGLSGEWLAPPNYHSYPTAVAQMHAERFAHMSLENYKRKIRVEKGEEIVAAWLEKQTKQLRYRPLSTEEILTARQAKKAAAETAKKEKSTAEKGEASQVEKEEETPAQTEEAVAEVAADEAAKEESPAPAPTPTEEEAPATPASEEVAENSPSEDSPEATSTEESQGELATEHTAKAEAETPAEESAETSPEVTLLESRREVERHFADHHFKQIFAQVDRAWAPGNVSAKLLSPGLLTLLKATVADERRYPSKLTPILCRQLSGRHLAVFKWKKKLKAGPARPHAVPDDIDLAGRPKQMLAWIGQESGKTLEELWKENLPADADKQTKQNFYHDFHWLLNQGFVLLLADSTVHLAKAKEPAAKKKAEPKPEEEEAKKEKPQAEEAEVEEAKGEETAAEETAKEAAPKDEA